MSDLRIAYLQTLKHEWRLKGTAKYGLDSSLGAGWESILTVGFSANRSFAERNRRLWMGIRIISYHDNLYRREVLPMSTVTNLQTNHWNVREGETGDVASELSNDHSQVLAFVAYGDDTETTKKKFAMLKQLAVLMNDLIEVKRTQKWDALVEALTPDMELSTTKIIEAKMMSEARTAVLKTEDFVTASAIAEAAQYSTKNPSSQPNRWKRARQIFAVSHKGVDLYPLYALDRDQEFRPLPIVREVLELFGDKKSAWETAFWFASVNSYLKNKKPKDVLRSAPEAVLKAAQAEVVGVQHG